MTFKEFIIREGMWVGRKGEGGSAWVHKPSDGPQPNSARQTPGQPRGNTGGGGAAPPPGQAMMKKKMKKT